MFKTDFHGGISQRLNSVIGFSLKGKQSNNDEDLFILLLARVASRMRLQVNSLEYLEGNLSFAMVSGK